MQRSVWYLLLFILLLAACDRRLQVCNSAMDCRPGLFCDIEAHECVACLDHSACNSDEFCCRGSCKSKNNVAQFCGCGLKIDSKAGANCLEYSLFDRKDIGGPQCLLVGKELTSNEAESVANASCGCKTGEDEKCRLKEGIGKNLVCVNGKCDFPDSCYGLCGLGRCIHGSCQCTDQAQCQSDDGRSGSCMQANFPAANGENAFNGTICACNGFSLSKSVAQRVSCPFGYKCCGEKGCCKESCSSASCSVYADELSKL